MRKKKGFGKKVMLTIVCGLLCGGLAAGGLCLYSDYSNKKEKEATEQKKEEVAEQNPDTPGAEYTGTAGDSKRPSSVYDVSVIWDNVIPSVVEIHTKCVSSYTFFGREYQQESEGSGTGVIVAQGEELYIVTNQHVIDTATAIEISFVDGTTAPATVKGTDAAEDIAVLSVEFSELSEATLKNIRLASIGDSDKLASGDMVIAIGNAAGSGQSLTVGYVSAVNREVDLSGMPMTLIQTDAAINPGNSGGPLLNAKGELIGINNAKLVAQDVEGIGYAIPISKVADTVNMLLSREEIRPEESAYLGVSGQDVTESLSEALNMPVGVYIKEVMEDSPAEEAGLPVYGVITEVNGIAVKSFDQLTEALSYIRGGTEGTVTVCVREQGEYVPKEYEVKFGIRGKMK